MERALLPHAFHGVETRIKRAKKKKAPGVPFQAGRGSVVSFVSL